MLYHKDIGLPPRFRTPDACVTLAWGHHAKRALQDDRYGLMEMFASLNLSDTETVEVEIQGRKVTKMVQRGEWDTDHDFTIVLIPRPGDWFVKTIWLNKKTDTHRTLDASRYDVP